MSELPPFLQVVAEVAGLAKALELARRYGGTEISLSGAENSVLAGVIGQEAALEVVRRVGAGRWTVPMATARGQKGRRAQAAELMAKGASARQAALACDIHTRTAWRAKAKVRSEGQGSLFDPPEEPKG